jgi:hypothetical protein
MIATGHDKFLRNEENHLLVNGFPFVSFSFTPVANTFWVTPDTYYLLNQQNELNDIALQTTKQRRLAVLKFLMQDGAMEDSEIDKIFSAEVGVMGKVKSGFRIDDVIHSFTPSVQNQGLYSDAEHVRRDAREAVGFSRNQIGEFESTGRRTATEAGYVQQGSSLRMDRRQGIIGETYVKIFEKLNPILFKHWNFPRWVDAIGPDGQVFWISLSGKMLKGDYSYTCQFTSEPIFTRASRAQRAQQMFGILQGNPGVDQQALKSGVENTSNTETERLIFKEQPNAGVQLPVQQPQMQQGPRPVSSPQ